MRESIVESLELPTPPAEIGLEAPLFGPTSAGGLGLDSLASLEILTALSMRTDLPFDDIEAADFRSVSTLADYIRRHGVETVDADQ